MLTGPMVDHLYSGTKAAETIIGGMFGGAIYSFTRDGVPSMTDLGWIVILFLVSVGLFMALHWWYEKQRGTSFD